MMELGCIHSSNTIICYIYIESIAMLIIVIIRLGKIAENPGHKIFLF